MKSTGNQLQVSGSAIYESANTREHCSTTKKVRFTARKELRGTYISVSTAVYCPRDVSLKKPPCFIKLETRRRTFPSVLAALSLVKRFTTFFCTIIQWFISILCKEYLLYAHWLHPLTSALIVVANWRGAAVHVHVSCTSKAEGKFLPGAVLIKQFGNAMEKEDNLSIKASLKILRLKHTPPFEFLCD